MKKIIIIGVSVLSVVLIGLAVAGSPTGDAWHRTPEERVEYVITKISNKLALDETQKEALDRMASETVAELQMARKKRELFKSDFMEILRKEQVSSEELRTLFDRKKPAIDDWMHMASEHIAEFHSLLSPEQRNLLIAEIESHHSRRCRFMR